MKRAIGAMVLAACGLGQAETSVSADASESTADASGSGSADMSESATDSSVTVSETSSGMVSDTSSGMVSDTSSEDGTGDSTDTDTDTGGTDPGGATTVFDESAVHTYELVVAPDDWERLNQDPSAEIYVPATLHFDGNEYANIGLRYKGSYGSLYWCFVDGQQVCPKLSLKLDFHEYVATQRFHGLKRLNLHAMSYPPLEDDDPFGDPSRLRERLAYGLFRDFGVTAPRSVHGRVVINGENMGLYTVTEAIDGEFTEDHFADGGQGNLYKEAWPLATTAAPYIAALETNEDQNPSVDKMVRFASELQAAGDAGFVDVLRAWTDYDTLMRFLAVDRAIDNWDGIIGFYCSGVCFNHNYYWYEQTDSDRLWIVPWDLDHTFDFPDPMQTIYGLPPWYERPAVCQPTQVFSGVPRMAPACDDIIDRLGRLSFPDYAAAARELVDTLFTEAELNARIDAQAAQIATHVADDPLGPSVTEWEAAVAKLRTDVVGLRDALIAEIER